MSESDQPALDGLPRNDNHRIDDPEQISQNTRIHEILDRRRETLQARDRLREAVDLGTVDERAALLHYRSRLESLIMELWNVFQNLDSDDGETYLTTAQIATFQIEPPEELREIARDLPDGAEYPDAVEHTIEGLRWYLDAPRYLTETFELRSLSPPQQIEREQTYVLQWPELDEGLRYALEFIDVAGIDADVTEQEQQTKIDRDLLEEVDEWRREHVTTSQ